MNEELDHDSSKTPLLPPDQNKSFIQRAISQTFQSTAHLANLLPTGSVLAFQLLSPIFTNRGECDVVSQYMTFTLISLCALSCFLLCFSDSFKDKNGDVWYGFATPHGLWVVDGFVKLPRELAPKYGLRFIDFIHGLMSVLVFGAIALFDSDVVKCFYPDPTKETEEVLTVMPIGIGVICSMLFVVFPTQRHGIGFPISTK